MFSDTQVKYESFIEDLNSMLNTGQVPNLFAFDERMIILDGTRDVLKKLNIPSKDMSDSQLWDYFLSRTRSNLHIVLAFR